MLLENHPSKAGELIQYISVIRNVAEENPTCRWLVYDQQFRLRLSRNPNRAWNSIDGELWLRFIATSVGRSTSIPPQRTTTQFNCYDYNYKGSCSKLNCAYKHACLKCQLQHPSIYCFGNLGQGTYNLSKAQINQKSNLNVNGLQRPNHLIKPRPPLK